MRHPSPQENRVKSRKTSKVNLKTMPITCRIPSLRKPREDQTSNYGTEGDRKGIAGAARHGPSPKRLPKLELRSLSPNAADSAKGSEVISNSDDVWDWIFRMFPDICPHYVLRLYRAEQKKRRTNLGMHHLVNAILENESYPKRQDAGGIGSKYDKGVERDRSYFQSAKKLLQIDYPDVRSDLLKSSLEKRGTLYGAYLALHDAQYGSSEYWDHNLSKESPSSRMPSVNGVRLKKSHRQALIRELEAAREWRKIATEERRFEYLDHPGGLKLSECQCCFLDTSERSMVPCTGPETHYFCVDCIRKHAEAQIGGLGHDIKCMHASGCDADFAPKILDYFLGPTLSSTLARVQQQRDIRAAGIEGLHDCPFCDFKAIAPALYEDRHFTCQNPSCRKVSCRMCNKSSHIPMTCEEAEKDKHDSTRHKIEEAMTDAVIRRCPHRNCGTPVVKEDGCNKMRCPQCNKDMCYVCKQPIKSYAHFETVESCCPTWDDQMCIDKVHEAEAEQARNAVTQRALNSDPDLNESLLTVISTERFDSAAPECDNPPSPCRPDPEPPQLTRIVHPVGNVTNADNVKGIQNLFGVHNLVRPADGEPGSYHPPWLIADPSNGTRITYKPPPQNLPHSVPGSYVPLWPTTNPPKAGPGMYQPPWPTANCQSDMLYRQPLNTAASLARWHQSRDSLVVS